MSKDGGPAFPVSEWVDEPTGVVIDGKPMMGRKLLQRGGMTLRDYFAAAALQGILTDNATNAEVSEQVGVISWRRSVANEAYLLADAMLAARDSAPEPAQSEPRTYDCGSGTNCGRDYCVAHGGHGGDS